MFLAPLGLLAVLAGVLVATQGPTAFWRHGGIGAGRAPARFADRNTYHEAVASLSRNTVWEADGLESSVAVTALGPSLAFVVNGKVDGNARYDAPTMIMSGLVGALLHPAPRRSMVIGLGTGASVPTMERTDVVELEAEILRVAGDCAALNRQVLRDPRVNITVGDAREALLVSRESYDLIFSEPSNPYRAGVASLFTKEYYEAIAKRLAPGGIFLQWVQAYEVDVPTIASIYATLASAFPSVQTWQVGRGDIVLLATREPVAVDVAMVRARLAQEPVRSAVRGAWEVGDLEGFLGWQIGNSSFGERMARRGASRVNTDDLNGVEFGFARTVGRSGMSVLSELRLAARTFGEDRPATRGGAVDWERVDDARARHLAVALGSDPAAPGPPLTPRRAALVAAFRADAAGDSLGFLAAWRAVGREPQDPHELRMLAGHLAATGDDAALPYVDRIRAYDETTALIMQGRLRLKQRRPEAVDLLCRALERLRSDPWPLPADTQDAVNLAGEAGQLFPQQARHVIAALSEPLALRAQDDLRLMTWVGLAARGRDLSGCDAIRGAEPNPIWRLSWLRYREACYVTGRDPRLQQARSDVREYLRADPPPWGLLAGAAGVAEQR
jgi:hypothetical protein